MARDKKGLWGLLDKGKEVRRYRDSAFSWGMGSPRGRQKTGKNGKGGRV